MLLSSFFFFVNLVVIFSLCPPCMNSLNMSHSSYQGDGYIPPLYSQGKFSGKVGYSKVTHVKINSNELFRNFFETYRHAISHDGGIILLLES